MITLTANQETILIALAKNTTIKTQEWVSTAAISEVTGLTKLVVAGTVCSLINKELLVSMKTKDSSAYQYTVLGYESVAAKVAPEEVAEVKPQTHITADGVKLTEKQVAVLKAIAYNLYCSVNGHPELAKSPDDLAPWVYVDDFASDAKLSVKTTKGVLGTLVKKGILTIEGWDEDNVVRFTDEGFKIVMALIK